MPCSDQYPSDYEIRRSQEQEEIKRRLDLSTRLLCTVMRRLRKLSKGTDEYPEDQYPAHLVYGGLLGTTEEPEAVEIKGLREWWINHQREDRKRKGAERRRAAADLKSFQAKAKELEKSLHVTHQQIANAKTRLAAAKKGKSNA